MWIKKIQKIIFTLLFTFSLLLFHSLSASAASASFAVSGGGAVNTGQIVSVSVNANSADAYNAISVTLTFNNMTFVSASAGAGWTPVAGPSQSGNSVSFSGALLGSSATGSKNVLKVNIKAPGTPGTATVTASGTVALANGSGTQVNGGGNTVTYTVKPAPTPTPTAKPAAGAVTITSTTHPDQTKWYKSKDASLSWNKDAGVVGFSYEVNQNPTSTPDDSVETSGTSFKASNLPEGKNYFHIKAKNDVGWGSASHFQINVDTTAPDPFAVAYVKSTKRVYFSTNDLSGIAKYVVKVDGKDLGEQQTGFQLQSEPSTIEVIAYDNAGNAEVGASSLSGDGKTSNVISDLTAVNASGDKNTPLSVTAEKPFFQRFGLIIAFSLLIIIGVGFVLVYPAIKRKRMRSI